MSTATKNRTISFLTALGLVAAILLTQVLTGCKSNNTTKGGAIGAGAGGVIGGVIGHKSGNTAAGAIIGAAVGGATGAIIGRQMDKQAEELQRDLEGAKVERVGEGILITFDSGLLFETNSSELQSATKTNLTELAGTLNKYDDTDVLIEGHTDNTGEEPYNQKLSERRADAVQNFLVTQGVDGSRVTTRGYGEEKPVASNDTEAGRASNRRVEVAIYANEKMKKAAKKGELGQ
jgi:outer membrane protein OmpA-like peptidoglycan-associated protein